MDRAAFILNRIPLAGHSLDNLLYLLAENRFSIDPIYMPRLAYSLLVSAAMTPARLLERVIFDRAIARTKIEHPPVFILGHWRSGTTFLHNVLSQDPNFGYISTQQACFPHTFLSAERLVRPLIAASLPATRPMDDVAMAPELPQEEEYALGAHSHCAYYHGWSFPRRMGSYERFVCMDQVSSRELAEWKQTYRHIAKKVTHYWDGRRLLLKNPPNTARVALLRELFPGAKFVHIHRNPYHVYFSTMKLVRAAVPLFCLQRPSYEHIEQSVCQLYAKMHRKYFTEREQLNDDELVELRYEDFCNAPIASLKSVYGQLGLPGFEQAQHRFSAYLETQDHVKAGRYQLDQAMRRRIPSSWDLTFDTWGYAR